LRRMLLEHARLGPLVSRPFVSIYLLAIVGRAFAERTIIWLALAWWRAHAGKPVRDLLVGTWLTWLACSG